MQRALTACATVVGEEEVQQFQSIAATATSDRKCASVVPCTDKQYQTAAATATENAKCADVKICTDKQYTAQGRTFTTDRTCATLSECDEKTQYQSVTATANSDRKCTDRTSCSNAAGLYNSAVVSVDKDSTCSKLTPCTQQQFQDKGPTANSDRKCKSVKECLDVEYTSKPPSATTNRECKSLTKCDGDGEFESVRATDSSDRECATNPPTKAPTAKATSEKMPTTDGKTDDTTTSKPTTDGKTDDTTTPKPTTDGKTDDTTTSKPTIVSAKAEMTLPPGTTAAQLAKDPKKLKSMSDGFADSIKVDKDRVSVASINDRTIGSRRLAETVVVEFHVKLESDDDAAKLVEQIKAASPADISAKIQKNGLKVTVSNLSASIATPAKKQRIAKADDEKCGDKCKIGIGVGIGVVAVLATVGLYTMCGNACGSKQASQPPAQAAYGAPVALDNVEKAVSKPANDYTV